MFMIWVSTMRRPGLRFTVQIPPRVLGAREQPRAELLPCWPLRGFWENCKSVRPPILVRPNYIDSWYEEEMELPLQSPICNSGARLLTNVFIYLHFYRTLYPDIQRHYWAAPFLLPIGTIFILALVVVLMILFKRCPQMVAAIVVSILVIIVIFAALISVNHGPIYV